MDQTTINKNKTKIFLVLSIVFNIGMLWASNFIAANNADYSMENTAEYLKYQAFTVPAFSEHSSQAL